MAGKKKDDKTPDAPPAPPETKANLTEEAPAPYPPAFLKGIKKAGFKEKDIQRMHSYDDLELWRVVFGNGQRHEFAYVTGDWLTKDAYAKKEPKKDEKSEKE